MKTGQEGLAIIKKYEGCHLEAYKCPAGIWTIGYGHTCGVAEGQVITMAQAECFLKLDLEKFEEKVCKYDNKYHWSQNEFDALVSFAYNIGNIEQLTANGTRTKEEIAKKMVLYNKASGRALAGLAKRRNEEQMLFMKTSQECCGIVEFSLAKEGNKQLTPNFKVKEFRCKDNSDKILIDIDFVNRLQDIRNHFNAPVIINSAYRSKEYNQKVGGANNSYHMKGQAFDIVVKGQTPVTVARYAQSIGIEGIIQYNGFVHVDSRKTRYWARNDNGKVTVKNGF